MYIIHAMTHTHTHTYSYKWHGSSPGVILNVLKRGGGERVDKDVLLQEQAFVLVLFSFRHREMKVVHFLVLTAQPVTGLFITLCVPLLHRLAPLYKVHEHGRKENLLFRNQFGF